MQFLLAIYIYKRKSFILSFIVAAAAVTVAVVASLSYNFLFTISFISYENTINRNSNRCYKNLKMKPNELSL